MGKQKKVLNPDPILKKDYKYEKRRKLKALQRQEERQAAIKEKQKKQQILKIQQEVQNEIHEEVHQVRKLKPIQKLPMGMIVKQKTSQKQSTIAKPVLHLKADEEVDFYSSHFAELGSDINITRQHHISKKQIFDKKIKQEVRSMFQMEEEREEEPENALIEEEEKEEPYILIKNKKQAQKQMQIEGSVYAFSEEAYRRKDRIVKKQTIHESILSSYSDYVFVENKEQQTIQEFRTIVLRHMLAHEMKCKEDSKGKGFTNGKYLIISPYVGDAKSIIDILESFYEGYTHENKDKLNQLEDEQDFFKIGISINEKKKKIKYFQFFNRSNIIIGSAVSLKALIGSSEERHHDSSMISSVQILYIDRASTILMQNWFHLVEVIKVINSMPKAESVCNSFENFRPSVSQLKSKLYRQSIVFTEFNFPQLNAIKSIHFHNWEGCITNKAFYPQKSISEKLEQNFYKIQLKQPKDDLEVRFDFFKKKFWDDLHNTDSMQRILIFVRSYFEFVKLKEFLTNANASADFISEHTKKQKVQSKLANFNNGKFRILLLSERAYYFGVCQLKNIQHVVFYSLPTNNYIYFEILREIRSQNQYIKNKIVSIYTKYDALALERVVGTQKAIEMVKQYCTNVSFSI